MKKHFWWILLSVLIISSMVLAGCAPAAEAPAAEAPAAEAPAATEAPAAEAPAATEAPAAEEPAAERTGKITFIDNTGFYTLNIFRTPWFTMTQGAMYDPMVAPTLELDDYVCVLCKDWEIAEDNLSVTFHLRDDVKFHDGTPFNAEAAKWNYEFYLDIDNGAQINQNWVDYFEGFEVVDEFTLKMNLKQPYAALFADLYLTYIASPTAYQELGDDGFGSAPVGTGPFIPVEIVENSHVLYKANPEYVWGPPWSSGQPPKVAEFEIRFNTDTNVSYAALESGEASYIMIAAENLEAARNNPDIKINQGVDWGLQYFGWNFTKPLYQNIAFREALAHAIDRDEAILAAFGGEAYSIASYVPPSTWGFLEEQNEYAKEKFAYDPELSKQILDEAGIVDTNGDGIREFEGEEIVKQFAVFQSDEIKRLAETIQSQLLEIGIQLEVAQMESATQAEMLVACQQEFFIRAYGLNDATIVASMVTPPNRNCWDDAEAQRLAKLVDGTMDPVERQKYVTELNNYMVDQFAWIPIFASYTNVAHRADLKGILWDKAGNPNFHDAYFE